MKCVVSSSVLGERYLVSVEEGAQIMLILSKAQMVNHEYVSGKGYEYKLKASSLETTFTLVANEAIKYPEDLKEIVKLTREEATTNVIPDTGENKE